MAGFLYGCGSLLMIEGGAIAAVAITFAEYTLRLVNNTGRTVRPSPLLASSLSQP